MWEIFFVLRQTIFQSQPNDFSISGERFSVLRQVIFRSLCGGFPFCSGFGTCRQRFPVSQCASNQFLPQP